MPKLKEIIYMILQKLLQTLLVYSGSLCLYMCTYACMYLSIHLCSYRNVSMDSGTYRLHK